MSKALRKKENIWKKKAKFYEELLIKSDYCLIKQIEKKRNYIDCLALIDDIPSTEDCKEEQREFLKTWKGPK